MHAVSENIRPAGTIGEQASQVFPASEPSARRGLGRTRWLRTTTRMLPLVGLALLPKCPLCLAMYLGFLTVLGVDAVLAARWTVIILLGAGLIILAQLLRSGLRSGQKAPFALGLAGFIVIATSCYGWTDALLRWPGLAIFCAGYLLHSRRPHAPGQITRPENAAAGTLPGALPPPFYPARPCEAGIPLPDVSGASASAPAMQCDPMTSARTKKIQMP